MFTNRPAINGQQNNQGRLVVESADVIENLKDVVYSVRDAVQEELLGDSNGDQMFGDVNRLKRQIETHFNHILDERNLLYNRTVRQQLLDWITADIVSYGPLEPLLQNPEITEIMVNRYDQVYIERFGIVEPTNVRFENERHLKRIIDRIVAPIGRRVDEASPMVDARLPNGFRVNATIPPLSLDGATLTIRKFAVRPFTAQDFIANATLTEEAVEFLRACVMGRINLVVSGGTGSGKTSLLNVLSSFVPENERIITIEDTAELQLNQTHVVRLEKRPPNIENRGEISIRQLVVNALRMRPDRIIVGECRSGEALDMLQAMNTGHDGSMTTIHSNSPRDTLRRIETMVLMAGMELPLKAIREQVASSIELIVHMSRLRDGSRKVVQITEVQAMEGDTIVMQDIFKFNQLGFHDRRVFGDLESTGLRPRFMEKLEANNLVLPEEIFSKRKSRPLRWPNFTS
jgi:pilus assembly protein CpaF